MSMNYYDLVNSEEYFLDETICKSTHVYRAVRSDNGSCHLYVDDEHTIQCAYYGKKMQCLRCNCIGMYRADGTDIIVTEVGK